jgi:subtilisin family serine protease
LLVKSINMREDQIILYARPATSYKSRGLEEFAESPRISDYKVAVEKVTAAEAINMQREDQTIAATAPIMPVRLIAPLTAGNGQMRAATPGVEAVMAHLSPCTGRGIKVAVLDTGIDSSHDCFKDKELHIEEKDFTNDGNGDQHGHGTHVAGTIFGRPVGGVRIGVAPGIQEVFIGKVLGKDGGQSDSIVRAVMWAAEKGAHIISMSLGIDFPGMVSRLISSGIKAEPASSMALEAYRKNVLLFQTLAHLIRTDSLNRGDDPTILVAAAGNQSNRPDYEIAVSPPAVSDGFISVAALDRKDMGYTVAPFSNTGATISGPGVDISSARIGGGLISLSGTSMAAPHVAGVAALWGEYLKSRGQFTLQKWTSKLIGAAADQGLASEKPLAYGAGMVQAPL